MLDGVKIELTSEEISERGAQKVKWDNDAPTRKKQELRDFRIPLLEEADHKINTLVDNGGDVSAWRTYRQELRDITKADDLDNVTFPDKPTS